jgi:peptide/nickel transport system permease protein
MSQEDQIINSNQEETHGIATLPFDEKRQRPSTFSRMLRSIVAARTPIFGFIILFLVIFMAIFANFIAPHDPNQISVVNRIKPPSWYEGGDPEYLLGTDTLGRDVLSRLIFGARVSLIVGFSAVFIAGLIGVTLGLIAGYSGGFIDDVLMRLADIQLAFPYILLAISVLAVINSTRDLNAEVSTIQRLLPMILTLGVPAWVTYARMVRGETLSLRETEYVDSARALGDSKISIMFRHIFPNALAPLIVLASFNVASTILSEASLSFLGLGVPASIPTWGGMLAESREMLLTGRWWLATIPGLAIMLTVLSINIIGDWLRDFYDPRLRN